MRIVLQRVSHARVSVDGTTVGAIGPGLVALVGVAANDTASQADALAAKCAGLRVFADAAGKFNRSLAEMASLSPPVAAGAVLVISQFTLLADVRRGRRPSFDRAAPPEIAEPLVERFATALEAAGVPVARGRFGAHMLVEMANDGPVTIVIDSADLERPRRG